MKKKILVSAGALALAVGVTTAGTLAWLQGESQTVTNTFTWSEGNNITLTLNEHMYDPATDALNMDEVVTENDGYKIIPGAEDPKDPTLHLTTDTESYVYILIDNGMSDYLDLQGFDSTKWTEVSGANLNGKSGTLYAYNEKVKSETSGTAKDIPVFTGVKYHDNLTQDENGGLTGTITLNGYAVQASAGTDAPSAWAATFGA